MQHGTPEVGIDVIVLRKNETVSEFMFGILKKNGVLAISQSTLVPILDPNNFLLKKMHLAENIFWNADPFV